MKPALLCVTPSAGPVTLHPLPDHYVRIEYWEKRSELEINLSKQWLLSEGWVAAAGQEIPYDLNYTFEG